MKRDFDLLRDMLLKMEAAPPGDMRIYYFTDLCDNLPILSLHIELLLDAGFIEVSDSLYIEDDAKDFIITRITFEGYDYLDAIRDDGIWSEIKQKLKAVSESATLDVVKALGTTLIMQRLGI